MENEPVQELLRVCKRIKSELDFSASLLDGGFSCPVCKRSFEHHEHAADCLYLELVRAIAKAEGRQP